MFVFTRVPRFAVTDRVPAREDCAPAHGLPLGWRSLRRVLVGWTDDGCALVVGPL